MGGSSFTHGSEISMDEIQIVTSSVLLNNATIKPTCPEINSDLPYCLSLNNEVFFYCSVHQVINYLTPNYC